MSSIGSRMTKQKRLIKEILNSTNSHPTADWVYEQARKEMPDISLGTVYRNLKVLVDAGEALELNYGSTFRRFDGNPENHYHFVCQACGGVSDLKLPLLEELNLKIAEPGVKVNYHRLEFYGVCQQCMENNNKNN